MAKFAQTPEEYIADLKAMIKKVEENELGGKEKKRNPRGQARMKESGKTISDKDRKEMMKKPTAKKRTMLPRVKGMKSRSPQPTPAKTMSDRDVEMMRGMMKMKEGGKVTEFGKAFAKARKNFLADTGPATFTFKGKKYNVQTAKDRKTTIGKKTARKEGITGGRPVVRGAPKGLSKAQTRALGLTGTARRTKAAKVKSDIKAAGARKAADVKSEEAKMKKAELVGLAVGLASGAGPGVAKGVAKGIAKLAPKAKKTIKTVRDVSAVARGKTKEVGKGRQLIRDKKGRVSEVSKKNIARGQTIRKKTKDAKKIVGKKLIDAKKLAATTTRIGLREGRRTGEAITVKAPLKRKGKVITDAKGKPRVTKQIHGISKKTIQRGKKIRRRALIGAASATPGLVAKAEREEQAQKMRAGGTFKGTF
jgi:hypothetical protein